MLGLCLRQKGVQTTIHEASEYPRHRVCGEFISGKGVTLLKQLGLFDSFVKVGATMATTVRFFGNQSLSSVFQLPEPALCVSRFQMDHLMSQHFQKRGGVLNTGHRMSDPLTGRAGFVAAVGRQPQMDRHSSWIGYKFHLEHLQLPTDLEMHFNGQGYLGMCEIEGGRVNVCGLYKSKPGSEFCLKNDWRRFLFSNAHPLTHDLLDKARLVEDSMCFVAGLTYNQYRPPRKPSIASIGDYMATIPPLTGNGMSMAMESAWLATEAISRYADHQLNWEDTIDSIGQTQLKYFRKRLTVAVSLQKLIMSDRFIRLREYLIRYLPYFHKSLFKLTR